MKKFLFICFILTGMAISVWILNPVQATYTPTSGDLIKTADSSAVFYINSEGKRQLFPNSKVFWTWYNGSWSDLKFGDSGVAIKIVAQEDFEKIMADKNIVARAGIKLINFNNSSKIYAVEPGAVLREVASSKDDSIAKKLYGDNYSDRVITIQSSLESNYSFGEKLTMESSHPDGSILKYEDGSKYYIENGERRRINDEFARSANGLTWDLVINVSEDDFIYESGENISGAENNIRGIEGGSNMVSDNSSNSCKYNEHIEGGNCVGNQRNCDIDILGGIGKQYWNGSSWDNCFLDYCDYNSGYEPSEDEKSCISVCGADEHRENGICVGNTKILSIQNGKSHQYWDGSSWGECIYYCDSGYEPTAEGCRLECYIGTHYENGSCLSNTKSCIISNGDGQQVWSNGVWGSCYVTSCDNGFNLEGNQCISQTKSCNIEYYGHIVGTGEQILTNGVWGDCVATSCIEGFHVNGGECGFSSYDVCTDFDNGKDYFTWSHTHSAEGPIGSDFCDTSSNLIEWYCQNGQLKSEVVVCPNGCNAGVCIR